ncbi:MAG: hypothetical protein EBT15_12600 [Betaproteobacteria bacterium]|nr:hypothetical protein [Betaproteobacteria bacterium]
MATQSAAWRLKAMLAQSMRVNANAPEVLFAMTSFSKFYSRFFNSCVNTRDEKILDRHQLVKVPRLVYLILKSLGFCIFETEDGEAPLMGPGGHPVCVQSLTGFNLRERLKGQFKAAAQGFKGFSSGARETAASSGAYFNRAIGQRADAKVAFLNGLIRRLESDIDLKKGTPGEAEDARAAKVAQIAIQLREENPRLQNKGIEDPDMQRALESYIQGNTGTGLKIALTRKDIAKFYQRAHSYAETLEKRAKEHRDEGQKANLRKAAEMANTKCRIDAEKIATEVVTDEKTRCENIRKGVFSSIDTDQTPHTFETIAAATPHSWTQYCMNMTEPRNRSRSPRAAGTARAARSVTAGGR